MMVCTPLCSSAERVQVSHAYRNIDMASVHHRPPKRVSQHTGLAVEQSSCVKCYYRIQAVTVT